MGSAATFGYAHHTIAAYAANTRRQLLHGHRYHYSHRELAHRNPSLQQHQPPTHGSTATVPVPARRPRREELGHITNGTAAWTAGASVTRGLYKSIRAAFTNRHVHIALGRTAPSCMAVRSDRRQGSR